MVHHGWKPARAGAQGRNPEAETEMDYVGGQLTDLLSMAYSATFYTPQAHLPEMAQSPVG